VLKKKNLVALVVVLFLLSCSVVAIAIEPIGVTVNGRALVMETQPVVRDGRTLVPLRAIFEALGASVEWDARTQTITGKRNGTTVTLQIDNPVARINNNAVSLDTPPTVISGRTMVPTRFIAESLGAKVVWNGLTRTVSITTDEVAVVVTKIASVRVIGVTDGDTIRVRFESGKEQIVRLIGVDTPESTREVEPFGKEAAAFTQRRLNGKTVFLEMDISERDRFGRLLAYVWFVQPVNDNEAEVRAKMFNAELLLQGYAQTMTITPNIKYADMFAEFEREARDDNKGLWMDVAPEVELVSGIVISSVDLRAESVTVKNRSANSIDVSGWILISETGNQRFVFPSGTTVPVGLSISVVSGPNAMAGSNRLLWTRSHIWNNDGDPAVLLDAKGREISRRE